jgi:hypothetical protein
MPVALRIRDRILKANARFHANDNISAFIEDGELEALRDEVAGKIDEVLQVLEGGRAEVNQLYGSIVRDSRHRDVTLLDFAEITERRFASWRMGSVNLNRVNLGIILRFSETSILDPFSMSGQALLALLDELTSTGAIVSRDGA